MHRALMQDCFPGVQKNLYGAQPLGHRQHPLAHRQARHDVIGEMSGGFHHAPRGTGRAHAPAFARVGDEKAVAALGTAGAGNTVGEVAGAMLRRFREGGKAAAALADELEVRSHDLSPIVLRQAYRSDAA
jgi:hypothetical protein